MQNDNHPHVALTVSVSLRNKVNFHAVQHVVHEYMQNTDTAAWMPLTATCVWRTEQICPRIWALNHLFSQWNDLRILITECKIDYTQIRIYSVMKAKKSSSNNSND